MHAFLILISFVEICSQTGTYLFSMAEAALGLCSVVISEPPFGNWGDTPR
jgi:hypothetical protein